MSNDGYGKHVWDIDLEKAPLILKVRGPTALHAISFPHYTYANRHNLQLFWITEWIYIIVQDLAKISITVFYLRIFPQRWFKITCYCIIVWIVSHGFAFWMVDIFQCTPVRALWDKTILNAHCVNQNAFIYAGAAFSISEDIFIILVPIPLIAGLNLSIEKKLHVIVMFSIGMLCVPPIPKLIFICSRFRLSY